MVGKLLSQDRGEGGLKLPHGFRVFFACEGRGRLALAGSVYRTSAWTLEYDKVT